MSVRIEFHHKPEFWTNLDSFEGQIVLSLTRMEQIGNIVVKLEGESNTDVQVPEPTAEDIRRSGPPPGPPGSFISEKHKILYKVQQVFPDEYYATSSNPYGAYPLSPGEHKFPFKFKMPINNACSDHMAMAKIGGVNGPGGIGSGGGLFGMGGFRVMDGSKQLFLKHITQTLPPSLTGFPQEAEIRYYIKVTIQRPGFLKDNWRFQTGFKFLPIEPPRPAITGQESYARRPFAFRPSSPASSQPMKKATALFSKKSGDDSKKTDVGPQPPSIEIAAHLPHPTIFTCNKPVPLKMHAKKLVASFEQCYLVSFQMDLIGITTIRSHNIYIDKPHRWVVCSSHDLDIPLGAPSDEVGKQVPIPDGIWKNVPLPNTVAPTFNACNISRRYELELKLGVAWGRPFQSSQGKGLFGSQTLRNTLHLPLHFKEIQIFSGITPPPELLNAARSTRPGEVTMTRPPNLPPRPGAPGARTNARPNEPGSSNNVRPNAPRFDNTRRPVQPPRPQNHVHTAAPTSDPEFPPQLAPGQEPDDAPPSYDEAMAENLAGPFDGFQSRPAYSGVTNEDAPSHMPEKH